MAILGVQHCVQGAETSIQHHEATTTAVAVLEGRLEKQQRKHEALLAQEKGRWCVKKENRKGSNYGI